jgi:SAM-dependent methyltransferase
MVRHGPYGIYDLDQGWVPGPRYILRRHRILRLIRHFPPGRVLDIGCGAGTLLHDLERLGHDCFAVESSDSAYELAVALSQDNPRINVFREPCSQWRGDFDVVTAFEVLEHMEDDRAALRLWNSFLKPDGVMLISVPAHQNKWNASDVGAGHFRRYERRQLRQVLEDCGLAVEHLEIYGFPLANVLERIRAKVYERKLHNGLMPADESVQSRSLNTGQSGIDRALDTRAYPIYSSLPGSLLMGAFCRFQSLFANTELGNGYLALARKENDSAVLTESLA